MTLFTSDITPCKSSKCQLLEIYCLGKFSIGNLISGNAGISSKYQMSYHVIDIYISSTNSQLGDMFIDLISMQKTSLVSLWAIIFSLHQRINYLVYWSCLLTLIFCTKEKDYDLGSSS